MPGPDLAAAAEAMIRDSRDHYGRQVLRLHILAGLTGFAGAGLLLTNLWPGDRTNSAELIAGLVLLGAAVGALLLADHLSRFVVDLGDKLKEL